MFDANHKGGHANLRAGDNSATSSDSETEESQRDEVYNFK